MAVAHALTFPDLFAPGGLFDAGPDSTAWLYVFWHGGFPLAVIAYALGKDRDAASIRHVGSVRTMFLVALAAVVAAVVGLTALATAGKAMLPAIMAGNHNTLALTIAVGSVWTLSLAALAVLVWRRPYSILDLWLMVVMSAWLFDVALSSILNGGRFDLGFYAGRVYRPVGREFRAGRAAA